jgi:hypothetical protein
METTISIQDKKTYYRAKGYVYGIFWGGGEGTYPSNTITSTDIDDLREQIMNGIQYGSLDSGMGYQRLIGAIMEITILTDIVIDDKVYTNKDYQTEFFGDLTESQQEFLDCQLYQV